VEAAELEALRGDVDALVADLESERFRHVAGLEPTPSLLALFRARPRAAHRDTVAALRQGGETALAEVVAGLRAERAGASDEEAWRAADAAAAVQGPEGPLPLGEAMVRLPREPVRERRRALGRAVAEAFAAAAPRREAAAEARARARAESGLLPDWDRVLEADRLLAGSDDAWRDLLGWLARQEGLRPQPQGDLERADLLRLLSLEPWAGLFPAGMLALSLREALAPLRLDLGLIRVDDGEGPARWPGAHAVGTRVSFRARGGAPDWLDLFDAAGRAVGAALGPPAHRRDPSLPFALGALLAGLLLDPDFLSRRLGEDRSALGDLARLLALRRLLGLRARAAALRVATEVERGSAGRAWHEAHREALSLAALAAWPQGLAARDADAGEHLAALRGAARAEGLRAALVERHGNDWWRNPRAADALAGFLAGGAEEKEPPLAAAGEALARVVDRGGWD
jgi:hypothetical protein